MEKTDFSDERKEYVKYLESEIPPFLIETHKNFRTWTGLTPEELSLITISGDGPDQIIGISGKIAYEKTSLVAWIAKSMEPDFIAKIHPDQHPGEDYNA